MKILLILSLFLLGCEQLPVKSAVKLMQELKKQGCELDSVSVSKGKSKKSAKIECK